MPVPLEMVQLPSKDVSGRKQQLQELYAKALPGWEHVLERHATELARRLRDAKVKVTIKRRIKSLESLGEKQSKSQYHPDHGTQPVKDLLGLRAVVPFLEDVETTIEILQQNWRVVEVERKSETLSFREFAYDAVHVIVEVEDDCTEVEFPKGVPQVCEVQVRTYLQDAWAEVEHELIYKSSLSAPDESIRKKLAALNASLALSDTVFQEIRDHQKRQVRWGQARFHELQKKAAQAESSSSTPPPAHADAPGSALPSAAGRSPVEQLLNEGIEAHNQKRFKQAVDHYSQALTFNPDMKTRSRIYNYRGMARFMLNEERAALKDFDSAVKSHDRNLFALNNRALAWRRMGVVLEALKDFDRSLEVRPGQAEVHFLKGQTLVEMGESLDEAQTELETALALQPDHRGARRLLDSCASGARTHPTVKLRH